MAMPVPIHSSTPYYDESEGPVLPDFMDAQEQRPVSHATRLSQAGSAIENANLHNDSTAQSPKSDRTPNFPEPSMRESGSIPHISTSTIPFPTINIDPATPQGSIQEAGIGPQGLPYQSEMYPQGPVSIRGTMQDPGPSNQSSRGSQYRQSRQEPAPEPSQPATDAQGLHQSLYSGDYESQILREFVDAQEQLSPASRLHNPYERPTSISNRGEAHPQSSRASQKSRAVAGTGADPGPSKRRSRQHSRSYNEVTISGATTTEEVVRQLKEQKKETNTVRRALRLAAERMDAENQRAVELERSSVRTVERFLALNESKLAAQQEALKAGSEMRVYRFQLESARKEIERAQEMVRTLENQCHEAEEAAARSRAELRKHAQEHMIATAKEEGRRLGFEAGLRRAEEEAASLDLRSRHVPGSRVHVSDSQVNALPADFDLGLSSPVGHHTQRAQAQSSHRATSPPPQPQIQSPRSVPEASVEEEGQPPRASESNRVASPGPSVLRYDVSIPPASEIEQPNAHRQDLGEPSQPWVTAGEYHQITGNQPSPENINFTNPSRYVYTLARAPPPPQGDHGKKKQSWLRRAITQSWRMASRVVPKETSYQPPPTNPPPSIRVRDFATGAHEPPRTSADHASVSTHFSQFDLVNPPPDALRPSYRNPNESTSSLAGGAQKGKRRMRERTPLHVINEDPSNLDESSPPPRDILPFPPIMGQIRELLRDTGSNYSDPNAVEEWRQSSASSSIAGVTEISQSRSVKPQSVTSGRSGPPRRRPVHLTVPPLLAPQATNPASSSTIPGSSSQNPALLEVSDGRPSLQRNPTSGTVYGITVEPPSCSPSEAPNSARALQQNLLSPNMAYAASLPSIAHSLWNNGLSSARNSMAPLMSDPSRVSGHSQAPPLPLNSSTTRTSLRSVAPTDHLRPTSVASHVSTHAPPRSMTDNASVRSGPRSVNAGRNVPQQGYSYPASMNPDPTSRQRNISDSTYLAPNGYPPGGNGNVNAYNLHRVTSNQSMNSIRSANPQYSRFDPNTYVEPTALYEPVSVGQSRQGERQRMSSNASNGTLSYIPGS